MTEPTPLPIIKIGIASLIVFTNSFMANIVLPFSAFMIIEFNVSPSEEEIGRYVGYLVASFMMGQFISSYFWGRLSDRYGRRPILLLAMFLTGLSFAAFGFSLNYGMALVLRLITGMVNGIIGVTKAYLSEITNSSNQAKGFGIFGVARGLGVIMGPIVGGYLCLPGKKYPSIFDEESIFNRYPFALPCLIGSAIVFLVMLLGYFVLEETNMKSQSLPTLDSENERLPLLQEPAIAEKVSFKKLFSRNKVYYSLLFYASLSFIFIQFDGLFAIWSRESLEDHGLGFSSSDQGRAYSIGGAMLFLYQIFLFPAIVKKLGYLKTFRIGVLFCIPCYLILPLIGDYATFKDGRFEWLMWVFLSAVHIIRNIFGVQAFTVTFIMIGNSVPSHMIGTINGIGQSLGSLGRLFGPVVAGNLFSWSLENGMGYPFDFRFAFHLNAVLLFIIFILSFKTDSSIDNRADDDSVST